VVVISFLGFDAISTLSEEVREGSSGRTVGRATMICIGVMATIFIVVSWLLADLGRGQAVNDVASAGFEIIGHRLPWLAWPMTLVAGLALGIGATIPPQAAVARVLYAMARERHLPLALTKLHPRFQTPHIAVLVVASLMAVAAFTALPHVDFLASLVSFSALAAFLFVNASVIAWFGVRKKSRRLFRHWIIPSAGFMVVAYILAGMPPMAIAVGIGWMVIGIVYYAGLSMVARRARFRAPKD
jgi:amino acid transporter